MKVRDSGMPDLELWESLLDVHLILNEMGVDDSVQDALEFGGGYGTFSLPAAARISGTLYSQDMDGDYLKIAGDRARDGGLRNIEFEERDFVARGSGREDESLDYVFLYNILHHEQPEELISEAYRVLKPGGLAGVVHWRSDISTPRGPELSIRPRPETLKSKLLEGGFRVEEPAVKILAPYHFGIVGRK